VKIGLLGEKGSVFLRVSRRQAAVGIGRLYYYLLFLDEITSSNVWLEFAPYLCFEHGDRRTENEFSCETRFCYKI